MSLSWDARRCLDLWHTAATLCGLATPDDWPISTSRDLRMICDAVRVFREVSGSDRPDLGTIALFLREKRPGPCWPGVFAELIEAWMTAPVELRLAVGDAVRAEMLRLAELAVDEAEERVAISLEQLDTARERFDRVLDGMRRRVA